MLKAIPKNTGRTFSPLEVAELFGITKTTLFRLEVDGALGRVGRSHKDKRDAREYSHENIIQLFRFQMSQAIERAHKREDEHTLNHIFREEALGLFLLDGDLKKFDELMKKYSDKLSVEEWHRVADAIFTHFSADIPQLLSLIDTSREKMAKYLK